MGLTPLSEDTYTRIYAAIGWRVLLLCPEEWALPKDNHAAENISAKQSPPCKASRIPRPDEDQERPRRAGPPPGFRTS